MSTTTPPQQCYKPDDLKVPDNFFSHVNQILDSLGADQVCNQKAKEAFAQVTASLDTSVMSMADLKAALGATAAYREMESKGCSGIVANIMKVGKKLTQAQCIMKNNKAEVKVYNSGIQSLSIDNKDLTDTDLKFQTLTLKLIEKKPQDYAFYSTLSREDKIFENEAYQKLYDKVMDTIDTGIEITNSNFTQTSTMNISGSVSLSMTDTQELKNTMNDVTELLTKMKLDQEQGLDALSPANKDVSTTEVSDITNLNSQAYDSKVSSLEVKVEGGNTIMIRSPWKIKLNNVNITQNFTENLALDIMLSQSITTALATASDRKMKATSDMDVTTKNKGFDDLAKQLGENQKNFLEAAAQSPLTRLISGIVAIVFLICGTIILFLFGKDISSLFKWFGGIFPSNFDSTSMFLTKIFFIILFLSILTSIILGSILSSKKQAAENAGKNFNIEEPKKDEFGNYNLDRINSKYYRRNIDYEKNRDDPNFEAQYNELYNKSWKETFGCSQNLSTSFIDYMKWDFKPSADVAAEMKNLINRYNICGIHLTNDDLCKMNTQTKTMEVVDGFTFDKANFCYVVTPLPPTPAPTAPTVTKPQEGANGYLVKTIRFGFLIPKAECLHFQDIYAYIKNKAGEYISILDKYDFVTDASNSFTMKITSVGGVYDEKTKDETKVLQKYGPEKVRDENPDTGFHSLCDNNELKYVNLEFSTPKFISKVLVANRWNESEPNNILGRIKGAQCAFFDSQNLLLWKSAPISTIRQYYEWEAPFVSNQQENFNGKGDKRV